MILSEEPDDPGDDVERRPVDRRKPAAPEEHGVHAAHQQDVAIFAQPEEGEAHRAVFGLVAGDELALRLGEVERRPRRLRHRRDEEDDRQRQEERVEAEAVE